MTDPRDPTRLCDLDPLLREAFDHARSEQPSLANIDAVVRGVEQAALGAGSAGVDASSSLSTKLALVKTTLVKIAVIIAVSSGLLWAAHSYRASLAPAASAAARIDAPRVPPATDAARGSGTAFDRDIDSAAAQPTARVTAPAPAGEGGVIPVPATAANAASRNADAQVAGRAQGVEAKAGTAATSPGGFAARTSGRGEANARVKPQKSRPDARDATPARALALPELALLQAAQQALRTSPERALELTDQHLREYPHGVFAQEREQIAIEALHGSGRNAAMRARAQRFQRAYPGSAHNARIAELLESAP